MYNLDAFMAELERKNPAQPEFVQAVREVLSSVIDVVNENPVYEQHRILERITEPERVITFRVDWEDDKGQIRTNRGYRVQFNGAIGPYKGGLRFHPAVTLGTLKFLGFEQTFKNSLTTLPMGGGKGGSDFNPKGKSDREILNFCRAFMSELYKYIGPDIDVPAGDIGVGEREIGYLFGQYRRLAGEHHGVLTGKGFGYGGSLGRPEATGAGTIYFAEHMLKERGDSLEGKTLAISGFGNVSWGTCVKATEKGAKVVTLSGPDGYIYDKDGVCTPEKLSFLKELRASNLDRIEPYAEKFNVPFFPGKKPWECKADMVFTCAIQNEFNKEDAEKVVANNVKYVVETSNMGCTADAVNYLIEHKICFAPGKAANAGGVSCSCLEMSQNAQHLVWSPEQVDRELQRIMASIHDACVKYGREGDYINYAKGANIAGFIRVADAMIAQGF